MISNSRFILFLFTGVVFFICYFLSTPSKSQEFSHKSLPSNSPELIVLGIAQDAGYPQADCKKSCCMNVWKDHSKRKMVSSLGVRDPISRQAWLFDATPDFRDQWQILSDSKYYDLAGIFLTHAHMGHYTGLLNLGREAMGAEEVPVYAMPRMKDFLSANGPWDQLVKLKNISIQLLRNDKPQILTKTIQITHFKVPHRDEYSETVGYKILGPNKKVLFIPDIDKWHKWDTDIISLIQEVDIAFLDGTFYRNGEIRGRDMSLIPHPFIEESLKLFSGLPKQEKDKIHFIHLNHTNPLLKKEVEYQKVKDLGFHVAAEGFLIKI